MKPSRPLLYWLRQDLRLADNPALLWAAKQGPVIPLYIFEDPSLAFRPMGEAAQTPLRHSLAALQASFQKLGAPLILRKGDPLPLLLQIAQQTNAQGVTWNRCYEPLAQRRDAEIEKALTDAGLTVSTHKAALLFEPTKIQTKSKTSYKVFTPFYRACLSSADISPSLPAPRSLVKGPALATEKLQEIEPLDEKDALAQLRAFIQKHLKNYKEMRDIPSSQGTSKLSTALRFGLISPRQIWNAVKFAQDENPELSQGADFFLREMMWREFAYHLLAAAPRMATEPLQKSFAHFPWRQDAFGLDAWQKGQTGYPLVDAGMRQLLTTGWMHNRVRMVVASFLVKHLLLPWQDGEQWFWHALTDADPANNPANWQWVAGCGADAAPFFRIFNPILQSRKFDPKGEYIRRFVPQLQNLPAPYIHEPWLAPAPILEKAGIILGKTYPAPIVEHVQARARALAALKHKG